MSVKPFVIVAALATTFFLARELSSTYATALRG